MFYFHAIFCFLLYIKNVQSQMFNGGYGGMFNSQYDYNPYSMYGGYNGYGMNNMGGGGYNNMLLNPYMDSMSNMGGMNNYGAMSSMGNPMGAMGGINNVGNFAMNPYGGYGMGNQGTPYYNNGLSFANYGNTGNSFGRSNSYSKTYGTPSNNNFNDIHATGSGGSYRTPSGNCNGRRCAWETSATKN